LQEFVYQRPQTVEEAVAAIGRGRMRDRSPAHRPRAAIARGSRQAGRIVDLKFVPDMLTIAVLPDGGVSIGAAVTASMWRGIPSLRRAIRPCGSAQLIGGRTGAEPREPWRQHLQRRAFGPMACRR